MDTEIATRVAHKIIDVLPGGQRREWKQFSERSVHMWLWEILDRVALLVGAADILFADGTVHPAGVGSLLVMTDKCIVQARFTPSSTGGLISANVEAIPLSAVRRMQADVPDAGQAQPQPQLKLARVKISLDREINGIDTLFISGAGPASENNALRLASLAHVLLAH